MLLVHGQPGAGSDWDGVVARLGPDRLVVAPNRPGYGAESQATTMAANAEILAATLRGLGGPPAIVVGHSYGGGIAILLADGHPDLVGGLVLVASIGGHGAVGWVDRVLAAPVVGAAVSAAGLAASTWLGPRLHSRLAALRIGPAQVLSRALPDEQVVAAMRSPTVWRSFVFEQRALIAEEAHVIEAVSRLAVPTVVMVGTRDVVVPPRSGARLAAAVPGSTLLLVAGSGHLLPEEVPHLVADAIVACEPRLTTGDQSAAQ